MGDKFQNKNKNKKVTAKDKKKENHLRLMEGAKEKTEKVVVEFHKEKKAA